MFKKAVVIGPPGSGKSTFSRALRDKTGLPIYYLDMLAFNPDSTDVPKEEFDIKVNELIQKDKWIIDGNYARTLESRLKACDITFLLDFPIELCLASAEARIGQDREDLPWAATEMDEEFKQFIINFPKDVMPKIYELLNKYKNFKKIIIFKSRNESDEFLKNLSMSSDNINQLC